MGPWDFVVVVGEIKLSMERVPKGVVWKVLKTNALISQFPHKVSGARTDWNPFLDDDTEDNLEPSDRA